MGLGIDIVKVSRITNLEALAKKILSKDEYMIYILRENKQEFLAGRWAAKEAFMKANGVGLMGEGAMDMKEISIVNLDSGKPIGKYRDKKFDVSISHEKEYAIAICIL